jgi:hypothetical protein
MHETSDDVRLEVAPDGSAVVQHHLRYRVVAGHFKTIDVVGVDPHAEIAPEAVVTPEKGGAELPARAEPVEKSPGTLRILIDEGKGLGRGTYLVDVKYRLDLVAAKALVRDGAMWKLSWTAPAAPEGHDGARVVFDLPSAPTEPRLAATADATTTLPTLHRSPGRDELELLRAHVPRGEAATWVARVDPRAFPRVVTPDLRPPAAPEVAPPSLLARNLPRILVVSAFVLLAGLLGALLGAKQRSVEHAAALAGALARPVLRVPWGMAPVVYGGVTSLGLASLLWYSPPVGALLVVVAMMLAAHRAPAPIAKPRGPGEWRPVPDRALLPPRPAPLPTDGLDIGSPRGRLTLAALEGAILLVALLGRAFVPELALALPLASAALLPLFLTGTRAQMTPPRTDLAARLLRPARDALASVVDLAHVDVVTLGRFVEGPAATKTSGVVLDELRLSCAPRDRTPGLCAVELAVATCPSGSATPEVLVRFDQESAAADRVLRLTRGAMVLRGRSPDERVARLSPEEATASSAAELVGRLVLGLEGRRATDRDAAIRDGALVWTGPERRLRAAVA